MSRLPPIVAFAAPSGTGKTTLIEAVVAELVSGGLKVGVLKSDAHRVVLDQPGKDSFRFAAAGAASVVVLSRERLALFERLQGEVSIGHAVARLLGDVDLVLAEGFRQSGVPSLRVRRIGGPAEDDWHAPSNVVGWVSDGPIDTSLPVLPLGEPAVVADWIRRNYLHYRPARQVTVLCAAQGLEDLAAAASNALRISRELQGDSIIVCAEPVTMEGVKVYLDLRRGLGLLGALYTGLAASRTPDVLLVGPRHMNAPVPLLEGLLSAPRAADVVAYRVDGHVEPALALYGYRCLSSIQEALLSDERRMTGWWGQVRTSVIDEPVWRQWDPDRHGFPAPPPNPGS